MVVLGRRSKQVVGNWRDASTGDKFPKHIYHSIVFRPGETDVVNTYQVWLRYELFRGTLSQSAFKASERNAAEFMVARSKPLALVPCSEGASVANAVPCPGASSGPQVG
jgi:hypothetical protein